MKNVILKITLLINLLFISACSGNFLHNKKAEITHGQGILLYINKQTSADNLQKGQVRTVVFRDDKINKTKIASDQINDMIVKLSAGKFNSNISSRFGHVKTVNSAPNLNNFSENGKYGFLIVPQIKKVKIKLSENANTKIMICYLLNIYDSKGKVIYSDKLRVYKMLAKNNWTADEKEIAAVVNEAVDKITSGLNNL